MRATSTWKTCRSPAFVAIVRLSSCCAAAAPAQATATSHAIARLRNATDPAHPKHVRDFGLVGYEPSSTEPYPEPQVAGLHQPFVVGNRMYLGYNSGEEGVLQIVDRERFMSGDPEPTAANLRAPEIARIDLPSYWGVHTAKPIYDFEIADYADNSEARTRDLLLVTSEAGTFRCQEPRDVMLIFDITEEEHPLPISSFQVPEEPGDFCHRGGRFGPHSFADAYHPSFDKKLVVLAYFNAGVRVVDIRNPFAPKEVARFIPEVTENTTESCIEIDGARQCDRAIQTNNVNLDDRGYIYALDRASTGLHVLELTGGELRLWPVTLYGALDELRENSWIREIDTGPDDDENRGHRRWFRITPQGRRALAVEIERMSTLVTVAQRRLASAGGSS